MPLGCDCYPGCWGDHSVLWPKHAFVHRRNYEAAATWLHANASGSAVFYCERLEIRFETEDLKKRCLELHSDKRTICEPVTVRCNVNLSLGQRATLETLLIDLGRYGGGNLCDDLGHVLTALRSAKPA